MNSNQGAAKNECRSLNSFGDMDEWVETLVYSGIGGPDPSGKQQSGGATSVATRLGTSSALIKIPEI